MAGHCIAVRSGFLRETEVGSSGSSCSRNMSWVPTDMFIPSHAPGYVYIDILYVVLYNTVIHLHMRSQMDFIQYVLKYTKTMSLCVIIFQWTLELLKTLFFSQIDSVPGMVIVVTINTSIFLWHLPYVLKSSELPCCVIPYIICYLSK